MRDVPTEEHFAVIYEEQIYVPGDERSRSNPGHGYPAEYVTHTCYRAFKSEDELKRWLQYGENSTRPYQLIKAKPLKVTKQSTFTFSEM